MSASVCVRNARTACISEGNHAGLVLLNLLTFMDTVDIPVLAFDETGSVPRGLEQLSGLAKEADYIQAVLSLVPWGVIKNNKDEERSYTDRRIQNAIYESMSIDEKQAAYTNMSFMLRRHYPDKAEAYEYTQAQLSTCKLLFPQVSYHLDRAIASGLKMCDYSAVAAIRAARYAFQIGRFQESKKMLIKIPLTLGGVNDAGNIVRVANALNFEAWTHDDPVSFGPAGTLQKAVSMKERPLDLQVDRMEHDEPGNAAPPGALAWLTNANMMFEESSLHKQIVGQPVQLRDPSMQMKNIVSFSIYRGWRNVKKGHKDEAEEEFKRAIRWCRDTAATSATGSAQDLWAMVGLGEVYEASVPVHSYNTHQSRFNFSLNRYGDMPHRVFTCLYKLAWLCDEKDMVTILSLDMENQGYKSHIARLQYHVAYMLRQVDKGEVSDALVEMAIALGEELEGPDWAPQGAAMLDKLVLNHDGHKY